MQLPASIEVAKIAKDLHMRKDWELDGLVAAYVDLRIGFGAVTGAFVFPPFTLPAPILLKKKQRGACTRSN